MNLKCSLYQGGADEAKVVGDDIRREEMEKEGCFSTRPWKDGPEDRWGSALLPQN